MMGKILNLSILIIFFQSSVPAQPDSTKMALEILERFVNVTGGRTLLEEVKDEIINFKSLPGTLRL